MANLLGILRFGTTKAKTDTCDTVLLIQHCKILLLIRPAKTRTIRHIPHNAQIPNLIPVQILVVLKAITGS